MQKIEGRQLDCPACGASLVVESAFTRTIVCSYCGQGSAINDRGLNPTGKMAKLTQAPSIFSLGRRGLVKGKKFKVLGRLRYEYEDGYWDEWLLEFEEGKAGWITEEEGECALFFKELITASIDLDGVKVGRNLSINNRSVFITEIQEASLAGGEGELHYRILPGTAVKHIEGNASGTLVSIEIWPKEIELHVGHPIDYNAIQIEKVA